jgi:transposase-like protein
MEEFTMADKTVRYTPEFKRQMVGLARSGRTPASLSKEFGPRMDDRPRAYQCRKREE